jgi:DNA mismatch endonuclease (patch repair protein)
LARLSKGNNPEYWTAKLQKNRSRDVQINRELQSLGWVVLRFWETDVLRDVGRVADFVAEELKRR